MPPADNSDIASRFSLAKWYLDCVADNGDGLIVYAADLNWKSWRIRYGNTLRISGEKVETRSSLRRFSLPESIANQITLKLPHLGVDGAWTSLTPPVERTIFENSGGAIRWHCLQPGSRVTLERSTNIAGFGYAELLEVSISPWSLPIRELRWGRFVSEKESVVWIDWRGSYCFRLLLHNGAEQDVGEISDQRIVTSDSHLQLSFDRGLVLRSGFLGKTVLPAIGRLARALPVKMLNVQEIKWRSRSTLRIGDRVTQGWSIHEVVTWADK